MPKAQRRRDHRDYWVSWLDTLDVTKPFWASLSSLTLRAAVRPSMCLAQGRGRGWNLVSSGLLCGSDGAPSPSSPSAASGGSRRSWVYPRWCSALIRLGGRQAPGIPTGLVSVGPGKEGEIGISKGSAWPPLLQRKERKSPAIRFPWDCRGPLHSGGQRT